MVPPAEGQSRIVVSLKQVSDELEKALDENRQNATMRTLCGQAEEGLQTLSREIDNLAAHIENLQKQLRAKQDLRKQKQEAILMVREAAAKPDIDVSPLRAKMDGLEKENQMARAAFDYDLAKANIAKAASYANELNERINANRERRAAMIQAAEFPVQGLAISETGVTLHGIPFSQCSSAEQLRVSVAIGLAANPKLKVLLIRDGSLLDDESLALVARMAEEAKAQVWIERVEVDKTVSVIIEDGHVKGQEAIQEELEVQPEPEKPEPAPGGCPKCGAPMAFGAAGKMVCTAECGTPSTPTTEPPPEE